MQKILATIIGIVMISIYIIPITLLRAWTIGTLWYWYIVPTFSLDPLRMVEAFGLSLFVSVLSSKASRDHKMLRDYMDAQEQEDEFVKLKEVWSNTKVGFGVLVLAILLGYIGIQFM